MINRTASILVGELMSNLNCRRATQYFLLSKLLLSLVYDQWNHCHRKHFFFGTTKKQTCNATGERWSHHLYLFPLNIHTWQAWQKRTASSVLSKARQKHGGPDFVRLRPGSSPHPLTHPYDCLSPPPPPPASLPPLPPLGAPLLA